MRMAMTKARISVSHSMDYFKTRWRIFLIGAFFISGLISGSLIVGGYSETSETALDVVISGFIDVRTGQSILTTFYNSLVSTVPLLIITFILGLCAIGVPFIPFISVFRGLGLGISMGYLYAFQGLKGIGYCALIIIPPAIVSSIAIILACKEALRFSSIIFMSMTSKGNKTGKIPDMKKYCLRFCVFLFLLIAAVIIDACFSSAFSRFFVF